MRWLYSVLLPTAFACRPPLRSNYNFHDVPAGSGFDLVQNATSVEDYAYKNFLTLEGSVYYYATTNGVDMSTAFDNLGVIYGDLSGAKRVHTECSDAACKKNQSFVEFCKLDTITCGDSVTASYDDEEHYYVAVDGNTWTIRYKADKDAANDPSDHILATEKVGVAAGFITPVTQECHKLTPSICPQMQTIQLMEPIMPTSTSNLVLGSSFVLEYEVESAKNYFYSMYSDLKTLASAAGLPPQFGTLGLSAAHTAGLELVYNKCVSSTDTDCEKKEMYDITCLGPTLDCGGVVKASYLDGDSYRLDTTENGWSVVYNESGAIYNKVLASASIGDGAMTITPMTQTNPSNPVTVNLTTPFEPLYLGAYDLGTTVTCEFGTPVSTCTSDVLSLSGCYATFREECDDTPSAANYIDKQCCEC